MYVYINSEPCELWTVGFYKPDGTWEPESDHTVESEAADRVIELNGGLKDAQRVADCADMSLRDYFAGQALAGMLANPKGNASEASDETIAGFSYSLADAMLIEREKDSLKSALGE